MENYIRLFSHDYDFGYYPDTGKDTLFLEFSNGDCLRGTVVAGEVSDLWTMLTGFYESPPPADMVPAIKMVSNVDLWFYVAPEELKQTLDMVCLPDGDRSWHRRNIKKLREEKSQIYFWDDRQYGDFRPKVWIQVSPTGAITYGYRVWEGTAAWAWKWEELSSASSFTEAKRSAMIWLDANPIIRPSKV